MNTKPLGIYLNDHLAGSVLGVELARRARKANENTELGALLDTLVEDIEADRDALMAIMDDLGIKKNPAKCASAWVLEKAGRLKPNGQITGRSALSRLIELEGLALGITGKLALWRSLRTVAEEEPRLDRTALERLAERARDQQDRVEERRVIVSREIFAS